MMETYMQLNIDNGSQTWAYDTGSAVETSPAINNTTLYMGTNNGNFYALKHSKWSS